jgi:hypothetical protein
MYEHKSSMNDQYQQGRPFGGIAWIYTRNLRKRIKIKCDNDSISTLNIDDKITLIGVYINSSKGQQEYDAVLDDLTATILNKDKDEAICLMGDFNGDMHRYNSNNGYWNDRSLAKWYTTQMDKLDMIWLTQMFTQRVDNTYQLANRKSHIDHIFIANSHNWRQEMQANIYLSDSEATENLIANKTWHETNLSDHRPVELILSLEETDNSDTQIDARCDTVQSHHGINNPPKMKLDWSKRSHIAQFQLELKSTLEELNTAKRLADINLLNAPKKLEQLTNDLNRAVHKAYDQANNRIHNSAKPAHLKRVEADRIRSWWNEELDEVHKLKKLYNSKYKESKCEIDKNLFNHYRNLGRKLQRKYTRENRNSKITELAKNHKVNRRKFWTITKKLRAKRLEVDIPLEELKKSYSDAFNTKLSNQNIAAENNKEYLASKANEIKKRAGDAVVNAEHINEIIRELKANKLEGLAGVTNEMIKHGSDLLAPVLTNLIGSYINYRFTPSCLNMGLLFPIIKDENESHKSINNTRPITVSDTIAIIYEKYMLRVIEKAFTDHELQFGFRKNYSTSHALFTLKETVLMYRGKNKPVYACFLDFSKAFDKINRLTLLRKMSDFLDDDHWLSVYQYYAKSTITIMNKGERTEPIATTLGCKQGGPMSPKLFSIYVDDLIRELVTLNVCSIGNVKTGVILYADDTTILCPTRKDLQTAISRIEEYCTRHEIAINAKKTKCLIFGNKQQISEKEDIVINGEKLEYVTMFKYLGVWLKSNFCCDEHVKKRKISAIAAAYRLNTLGLNTNILSTELKSFLLNVYCRSSMQYGVENTYLTEKAYNEYTTVEANIIKRALGLSKYHSTTMIMNALDQAPTAASIKIRKLSFTKQLCQNKITYRILGQQFDEVAKLATKSHIRELVRLTETNIHDLNIKNITSVFNRKVKEIKNEIERAKGTKEAIAIRYLLSHRNKYNDDLLRKLTHWSETVKTKKAPKRRQKITG